MGMGKSLTLIALIMHTLNVARASEWHRKVYPLQGERAEAPAKPTLIIAPKSSIGPCPSFIFIHLIAC